MIRIYLILALGGCRAAHTPEVTVIHEPGDQRQSCRVPFDTTYALYSLDKTPNQAIFIGHAAVVRDGHVGFTPQADGTLDAFAGAFKVSVPEGRYIWQIETPKTLREKRRDEIARRLGKGFYAIGWALMVLGVVLVMAAFTALGAVFATGHG